MSYLASMNFHNVKAVEIKPVFGRDSGVALAKQFRIIHANGDYIEITTFGSESGPVEIIQGDAT
jgi:hypothetical protein